MKMKKGDRMRQRRSRGREDHHSYPPRRSLQFPLPSIKAKSVAERSISAQTLTSSGRLDTRTNSSKETVFNRKPWLHRALPETWIMLRKWIVQWRSCMCGTTPLSSPLRGESLFATVHPRRVLIGAFDLSTSTRRWSVLGWDYILDTVPDAPMDFNLDFSKTTRAKANFYHWWRPCWGMLPGSARLCMKFGGFFWNPKRVYHIIQN